MRYWDASALVPLLVREQGSELARQWLREDPKIATWLWTRVELTAALERYVREHRLSAAQRRQLLGSVGKVMSATHEVSDALAVRQRALPLLARHSLRAADAGQLAAALLASEDKPSTLEFVCLDERLRDAAEREGFIVTGWPEM